VSAPRPARAGTARGPRPRLAASSRSCLTLWASGDLLRAAPPIRSPASVRQDRHKRSDGSDVKPPFILQRLTTVPVVVMTGARTVGKSTILAACARAHGSQVLDLDDMPTRRAVASDPSLYAQGPGEPVCIDEFQHVPAFLDAIKAELNTGLRPGRFLLTGSTRYDSLPRASQSLTGRAHIITMWPFSQGELRGIRENFIDTLLNDAAALVSATPSSTARASYEQMIVAGGFPIALSQPSRADRDRWFKDFITMIVQRDVMEIRRIRQRAAMPELLRHLASQSAGVLNITAIAEKMGMDARTLADFVALLEAVFLVHRLPAFGRTLSKRTPAGATESACHHRVRARR
jgi:uncharacterized protein